MDDETPEIPETPNPFQDEVVIPNHRVSRDSGGNWFRKAAGDKRDTKVTRPRIVVPKVKPGHFVEPLTAFYAGFGLAIMPFDPVCANAVLNAGPQCAESLDKWSQTNDNVRRALFAITQTTAFGLVFVAHLPIILAVLIHHVPAAQNYLGQMGAEMAEDIARQMEARQNPGESPNK
jgi:hypothetical protein